MSDSSLKNVDLIIDAKWVIPIVPNAQALEHFSVVVDRGKIVALMPTGEVSAHYHASSHLNLSDHALIPGLVNAHTHAGMTLMRGLADDRPLMEWLNQHIWPAENRVMSEYFVEDGTVLACAEMLAGGITCFNDMYFYPQASATAADRMGMRASLGLVVLEFPSPYAADAEDYLIKGLAFRDTLRGHERIHACIAPHAPYTVSDKTFNRVMTYADQLGLNIHLHLHETLDEIRQSEDQHGLRPIQRLAGLGLLGPNVMAAHCVHLTETEIALLSKQGSHVVHCPSSNLKLGSGIAPVAEMVAAGVNVALGTDGAASNNRLDMFAEMRLAALLAKSRGDATALPAASVLEMATLNGAKALGLEETVGSIEPGKWADMVAVDFSSSDMQPCFDPISHLVYVAGREHVSHSWVAGELRYCEGVHPGVEDQELKEITAKWQEKLKPFHR